MQTIFPTLAGAAARLPVCRALFNKSGLFNASRSLRRDHQGSFGHLTQNLWMQAVEELVFESGSDETPILTECTAMGLFGNTCVKGTCIVLYKYMYNTGGLMK